MKFKRILLLFITFIFTFSLSSCFKKEDPLKASMVDPNSNSVLKKAFDASVSILHVDNSLGSGVVFSVKDFNDVEVDLSTNVSKDCIAYILTNAHVVSEYYKLASLYDSQRLEVIFTPNSSPSSTHSSYGSYKTEGFLVGLDKKSDLAVVKTVINPTHLASKTNRGLASVSLLNEDVKPIIPKIGSDCFAIGSPLSLNNVLNYSKGHVKALNKGSVHSTAAIAPGNSGGGLFDAITGKLIGVNTRATLISNSSELPLESGYSSIDMELVLPTIRYILAKYNNFSVNNQDEYQKHLQQEINVEHLSSVGVMDYSLDFAKGATASLNPSKVDGVTTSVKKPLYKYTGSSIFLINVDRYAITPQNTLKMVGLTKAPLAAGDLFETIIAPYAIPLLNIKEGQELRIESSWHLSFYLNLFDVKLIKKKELEIKGYTPIFKESYNGKTLDDYKLTTFTVTF